jgi:hypothetical protein
VREDDRVEPPPPPNEDDDSAMESSRDEDAEAGAPDDPGTIGRDVVLRLRADELSQVEVPARANEPPWPTLAGSAYRDLIKEQFEREENRKSSFETRGMSIITSSGAIVTLLFGLAALATKSNSFHLTGGPKAFLAVALGLLLVAAVCGIAVNVPLRYEEGDPRSLLRLLEDRFWNGRVAVGQKRAAELELAQLARARGLNSRKGKILIAGLAFEVLGVVAVAISVLLILL